MRIKLVCPNCKESSLDFIVPFKYLSGKKVLTCLHCHGEFSEDKWKKTEDKIYD
jgi:uncharacterized CHY-type Zn-finger protein